LCLSPQWLIIPCTCPQPLLIVSFPSPAPATPVSLIPDVPHLCFPPYKFSQSLPCSLPDCCVFCPSCRIHSSWPVCFEVKTFVSQTWSRTVLLHRSLPMWTCDKMTQIRNRSPQVKQYDTTNVFPRKGAIHGKSHKKENYPATTIYDRLVTFIRFLKTLMYTII